MIILSCKDKMLATNVSYFLNEVSADITRLIYSKINTGYIIIDKDKLLCAEDFRCTYTPDQLFDLVSSRFATFENRDIDWVRFEPIGDSNIYFAWRIKK